MPNWKEQLASDYEQLLARLAAYAKKLEVDAPFSVYAAIEELRDKADDVEEWTQDEIDELMLDAESIDGHLREAGRSFVDWLRLDAAIIEEKLFSTLTDETKLAWLQLRQEAHALELSKKNSLDD